MEYVNKPNVRFIFVLNILFCLGLQAQDIQSTFELGKEQFAMGNSLAASSALQRVLYFGKGIHYEESLELMGRLSLRESEPERAAEYYGRAALVASEEQKAYWYILRKASCYLQLKRTGLAKIELLGIPDQSDDSLVFYRNFLLGTSFFIEKNFTESKVHFHSALPETQKNAHFQIDSLFTRLAEIKHPNPKIASTLSVIIPGLGQFYAGDVRNGLNSFLLTAGFMALAISTSFQYGFVETIASVIPWLQRYYTGGYKRAKIIAAEKLESKQNKIYQDILHVFESQSVN